MSAVLHNGCFNCGADNEPVLTSLMRIVQSDDKRMIDGEVKRVTVKKATSIALCSRCAALPPGHVFGVKAAA